MKLKHPIPPFASTTTLCALFNVSLPTIKRWRRQRLISPHHFEKNRSMYDVAAVHAVWKTRRSGQPIKKSVRIFEALQSGARTAVEIASIVDLPHPTVCAHLNDLKRAGVAKIVKKWAIRFGDRQGCRCHEWKAV